MIVYQEMRTNPFENVRFSHAFDDSPDAKILNDLRYTVKIPAIHQLMNININRNVIDAEIAFDTRSRASVERTDLQPTLYTEACIYTHMLEHGNGDLPGTNRDISAEFKDKLNTFKQNFEKGHKDAALSIKKEVDKLFPVVPA